ncbi:MAG: BTAD domain-containing putative transcriptional regulator, partial [Anaerolineales bacterium]
GQMEQAAALYQGDFLEDFYIRDAPDFEGWVLGKRAYIRELALQLMHVAASEHTRQGHYKSAIEFTRRFLSLEPWREGAHRDLIRLLAYTGQRGAALAQYEACRLILQEEFGVDPSEETQKLYRSIQRDDLRPPSHHSYIKAHRPAFLDEDNTGMDGSERLFVGREAQLSRLVEYLEDSRAGRGRVAFVSAEAGWGKTSLLANFSCRAQEIYPDLIVASGICTTYTGTGDPYLPFREILRMLCGDVEWKWAAGAITRSHALRIWNLLPSALEALTTRGRNLVDTFVSGEALQKRTFAHESISPELTHQLQDLISHRQAAGVSQERIFEEYTDVLREISKKSPLLLILDDLHWADASSINLLFHLGQRLMSTPILVLCAYRPEEIYSGREGKEHPLESVLREFKRLFGDTWLYLDQDRFEEDRQFVDALLDVEPNRLSGDFREQLAHNTGGHPLFTVEMLQEMKERGDVYQDEADRWIESPTIIWDSIPGRVEGVIEKRVNRLDRRLREVLVTASVEGEEFTAEVIAQAQGIDEEAMVAMLSGDLAKRHNLVRARQVEQIDDKRISHYQFRHNLFQKYFYSTLDAVERVYQHEAIGNALEKLYHGRTEEIAIHLARHFQEAGVIEKAIEYLKQAGENAARVYANAEATVHFSQAIHLSERVNLSDDDISSLYTRLGRALELESSFNRALEIYEELGRLAIQRGNRVMELASLMARITILSVPTAVHGPKRARGFGERALVLASELDDPVSKAKILWSLSIANFFSSRLEDAVDYGERSLALARRNDLCEQTAQTLNDLGGFIYLYSGRIDSAREALQEANDLWRDLGNTPMLADSLSGSCVAHVYSGDFDQAVAYSQEAYQLSSSIKNLWGQSYSRWTIGDAFAERGEFSRAIEAMEECICLGKRAGFFASQTYTRVKLAQTYMDLGSLDKAFQLVQEALKFSQAHIPTHIVQGLGVLARLQILQGNLVRAEATIKEGHKDPYRESWVVFYLPVLFAEADLALCKGDPSSALAV